MIDVERLQQVITECLMDQFEAQGHRMTGKLIQDIEYKVKEETNRLIVSGYMYFYGNILSSGVKKERIPFSGRTGAGGTSLYIQALQSYAKQRMNIADEKKSLSVAFAIAHAQKKQGMPTRGSYAYSSTGKRLEWIEEALKDSRVEDVLEELTVKSVTVNFETLIDKWQKQINN